MKSGGLLDLFDINKLFILQFELHSIYNKPINVQLCEKIDNLE